MIVTAIFGSFSAEQRCSDDPVRQCWLVELVLIPVVIRKGRGEAQKFSCLWNMNKRYLVGTKGKLQRGGCVQGRALPRREIEKLWLGQEKENQGVLGATENLAARSMGTVARLHHSHARLAVNCLSQMCHGRSCSKSRNKQNTALFRVLICYRNMRGLCNV